MIGGILLDAFLAVASVAALIYALDAMCEWVREWWG